MFRRQRRSWPKPARKPKWGQRLVWLVFLLAVGFFSYRVFADELAYRGEANAHGQERQLFGLVLSGDSGSQAALQLSTDVNITVSGMLSRAVVKQQFVNDSNQWQQGRYVFPLPTNAAVDRLKLWIGERFIEGEIQTKQRAREQYTQAQQQGKKTSLVEQHRPNIFSTEVANIAPGETVVVEIEYQQMLDYRDGEFSLRFPSTVGPRYIPGVPLIPAVPDTTSQSHDRDLQQDNPEAKSKANAELTSEPTPHNAFGKTVLASHSTVFSELGWGIATDQVPDAPLITPFYRRDDASELGLSIAVLLDMGLPLASIESNFAINREALSDNRYQVSLAQRAISDRDFVLRWQPTPSAAPRAALFREAKHPQGDFALAMIMPPQPQQQGAISQEALPRHLTFVLDISGSMHGESMRQARLALLDGLARLKPEDTFSLIVFNHQAKRFGSVAMPADDKHLARAHAFVRSLKADGGTEIAGALALTFAQPQDPERLEQVVFITDGSVGNEQQLFTMIERDKQQRRLFMVGIGTAPNGYFMRRAARVGQGSYTFIAQQSEVQRQMQRLFAKLSQPVMHNLSVSWLDEQGVRQVADYWPRPLPDLYQSEPLLVSVKVPANVSALEIKGQGLSQPWQHRIELAQAASGEGIAVQWAREQIASIKLDSELEREQKRQQIQQLGLDFHLVTDHTSLVAVDKTPSRPLDTPLAFEQVAPHMPAGWNMNSAKLLQTGLGSRTQVLAGVILCLLAWRLWLSSKGLASKGLAGKGLAGKGLSGRGANRESM